VLTTGTDFSPVPVLMKGIRLQGILVGSRVMFEEMNSAIEESGLRPVIDRGFDFAEMKDAMRYMESGAHFGKVVVKISK
jgi:NADPH:quinone reductase-like Zn-dependent oxidoreductase